MNLKIRDILLNDLHAATQHSNTTEIEHNICRIARLGFDLKLMAVSEEFMALMSLFMSSTSELSFANHISKLLCMNLNSLVTSLMRNGTV